jgi:hypothetical protein
MTTTTLNAASSTGPTGISSGDDGTLTIKTGVTAGSQVNALVIDAAGKVSFPQNQTGSAPFFSVRAWCVVNGTTAGTNAPLAGGNVTSVTRNSAGNYTVNFTTAMPDALGCPIINGNVFTTAIVAVTASTVTFVTPNSAGSNTDGSFIAFAILR